MSEPTPLPLTVAIIGGGIHGTHVAARLVDSDAFPRESLRVFDPANELLAVWKQRVAATGMTHLRSPAVHHLDIEPVSLLRFCHASKKQFRRPYVPPYNRPSVELFEAHCDHVIERMRLDELHEPCRIIEIVPEERFVRLKTDRSTVYKAVAVVVATGNGERLVWPTWSDPLRNSGRVEHILSPDFDSDDLCRSGHAAVIGGGLSAGQFALRLVEAGVSTTLICPHGPRSHDFDSDPGWLGPKYMDGFSQLTCTSRRRATIIEARNTGTLTKEIFAKVRWAQEEGLLDWRRDEVTKAVDGEQVRLVLDSGPLDVDRVYLATGFGGEVPSASLIDPLAASHGFPVAECGFPVPDRALRWGGSQVFVAGGLAELELGPSARNISGARRAADRIVPTLVADAKWVVRRWQEAVHSQESVSASLAGTLRRSA